jgi:hypothetical protein
MRRWVPAGAGVLVAVTAAGGAAVMSSAGQAAPGALPAPPNTVKVKLGKLSDMVSLDGTLTYRARSDGSPYAVINQARGTYTKLPAAGDKVDCGDVFYRVDDHPVLLLCGAVPAYRDLHTGDHGRDVRQLNRSLHVRGAGDTFTAKTAKALEALQRRKGLHVDGSLSLGDAVFLPKPVRVAKVTGELGGSARPGAPVAQATSDALDVQVGLDASQQGEVKTGDRALITLPGNRSVTGKVKRLGRVAQAPAGQSATAGDATIAAYIGLDRPRKARGLDRAPVQVDITTKGVASALSVPVTALVGRSGGGFAVEVVRAGGRRELVAVKLGLFDDTDGRVAVEGDLHEGDPVVVPSL